MNQSTKKMTLIGFILMIFTSVFGFANSPLAYYLMGYSAILFYATSAIFFFIPFAFMMAEMGSSYSKEEGGMYSWMKNSVGPRYAFVGTSMWFSSYVIWMVTTAAKVWVPLSTFLFGEDKTQTWSLSGLNSTQFLGILAVSWMMVTTLVATRGINKITRFTTIGGMSVTCLNLILLLTSVVILFLNGGCFSEEINFIDSPNPSYQSNLSALSFAVFTIFAYSGIEAVGSLVDKMENPERNFAKGIILATVIISIGYSLAIFAWGVSANWKKVLNDTSINLGNITYVLMYNLGLTLGHLMKVSQETTSTIALLFSRITGLSMSLSYTGAFFTLIYSPLKTFIQGTPNALWPEPMKRLNATGMPANAMWLQCLLVCLLILLISFSNKTASAFYNGLTLMANVSMTLPYLFLVLAFPFFKRKKGLERPFVIFKNSTFTFITTVLVFLVVALANIFTVIRLIEETKDWKNAFWVLGGPIFFSLLAMYMYENYNRRLNRSQQKSTK